MLADSNHLHTANEAARQRALRDYFIAGTAPEKLFDDLAGMVARVFRASVGLVSLAAADEVWFKAQGGLPGATKMAREDSLCSVVVQRGLPTVFGNLEKAPCALVNPDVARALELRFYAGAPLIDEQGNAIGVLCVMDHSPRSFSPPERELLTRLANVVIHTIELRLAAMRDPSANNLPLTLAFNALRYSIERMGELVRPADAAQVGSASAPVVDYSVVNEIIDYVQGFVGGTLRVTK